VEGRLRTRSYEKDDEKRYVTEIVAQRVQFLGPRPNGGVIGADQALPADEEPAPF
jgi:single-strand DNA-binding protein